MTSPIPVKFTRVRAAYAPYRSRPCDHEMGFHLPRGAMPGSKTSRSCPVCDAGEEEARADLRARLELLASLPLKVQNDGVMLCVCSTDRTQVEAFAAIVRSIGSSCTEVKAVGNPARPLWRIDFQMPYRAKQYLLGRGDLENV